MTILPRTEADYVKTPDVMYSIPLTEKEVRRIGERRYTFPRRLLMGMWTLGPGLVITVIGSTIRNPSVTLTHIYGYVLLVVFAEGVASIAYFYISANREGKAFLKEQEISKGGQS